MARLAKRMERARKKVAKAGKYDLAAMQEESSVLQDVGLLLLRVCNGSLLTGHGAQMLFGLFGGSGLKGTADWLESQGLKPGRLWATIAGSTELSGGLTALGLFHPLGEIGSISAMIMAIAKSHWGKPIWVTSGGAELPVLNIAIATTLIFTGPGRYSLDRILGIKLPVWLVAPVALGSAASLAYAINSSRPAAVPPASEPSDGGTATG